jgi:aminoglycoside phosphotransferase (APT) family kinase protein
MSRFARDAGRNCSASAPAGRYGAAVTGFTPRLPWTSLDVTVRAAVEEAVLASAGSAIQDARDVHGGMSPGPAAVLTTTDGQQVFVKITSSELNQRSYQLYADEIAAYRALDHLTLPMPELLSVVEHGSWIGLVLTVAGGVVPGPPWDAAAVDDVARTCRQVGAVQAPDSLPRVLERLPDLDGWEALASGSGVPPDEWHAVHARPCADLVQGWRSWTAGRALAHNDLRSDNVLRAEGRGVTLVDWNFASAAAPWLDQAQLAADVMASGVSRSLTRPAAETEGATSADALDVALGLLAGLPEDAGRFVVALAGMLRRNSTLPAHPALPTMRSWQAARADRLQPLVEALVPALLS